MGTINFAAENLSREPTKQQSNAASLEPITPGGLTPSNNVSTLGKMQAGSLTAKLCVVIEGCKHILSDAPSASVLAAGYSTDFTSVLGGLFVELQNTQSISPDDPLPKGGKCIIRVLDEDHTDTFGIYVHKRASGDKTTITTTHDRTSDELVVASTQDFATSGDVYIGTECVGYSGKFLNAFDNVTRGKYPALGCDSTGSGGSRFARHHRVSTDPNTTLSNPVVSEVPRNWLGKYVSVYLHTWHEATQQLNTRAQAQLLYAGRIVGIADNASDMTTDIEVAHVAEEFRNGVIGADLLAADLTPGLTLIEGRTFRFNDRIYVSTTAPTPAVATDLVVVSGAPANAYEVQAGYYNGDEICAVISRWLAQARVDADINGNYTLNYAVSSGDGPRSKIYWKFTGTAFLVSWGLEMPGEVAAFLGFGTDEDAYSGHQVLISDSGKPSNESTIRQGDYAPYSTLIFAPFGPSIFGLAFTYALTYEIENERGVFIDQTALMPAVVKEQAQNETVGLFVLDEKILFIAQYDEETATLTNARLAPFQLVGNTKDAGALQYVGRRMDEPPAALTIRQVLLLDGTFKDILSKLVYSTGTTGYNHGTHDTLSYGFGLAIPGQLLGPEWDRSLENLPGANSPISVMIDKPIKFSELMRDDLLARRAFIRWHNQGFEFRTWRTPLVALADHTLNEDNKAAPVGTEDGHRVASQETDQWHYSKINIQYGRDFASSKSATYLNTIQLEDQAGTDGSGALGRTLNLKMRNTFSQFTNAGAAIEELIKEYLVGMPMFSRPSRTIVRSISMQEFETIGVGDICIIEDDPFARDPLTGQRGISARAAIVTRVSYNLGGPTPQGKTRDMVGEVELFFLDTHRGGIYSAAADVDSEKNYSGFSAGYNSTTSTLWLQRGAYTPTIVIQTRNGPITHTLGHDADYINDGDEVVIVEIDPSDTAAPVTWQRTVSTRSGDFLALTSGLSSPAWDATKKFRVIPASYGDCTATQQDLVFQADSADEMIEDVEVADQYSSATETVAFVPTATTDKAEFVADLTWGDGKPLDVGTDAALAKTANAFTDYKSALQCPMLWSETPIGGSAGETLDTDVAPGHIALIHLGSDILTSSITRDITIALFIRSSDGSPAYGRVALARHRPTGIPSVEEDPATGLAFYNPQYGGHVSRSDTYSTSSTTWHTSTDLTLSVGVKDLQWGCAWLIVELSGSAQCRGIAKLVEGPRTAG